MTNKIEFKREERYIVLKVKDLEYIDFAKEHIDSLNYICQAITETRKQRGGKLLECVVIESDWPEYEPVWKMIESRMKGEE